MSALDLYIVYQFVKILTTPWEKMPAFKFGIIDKNGHVLKKRSELKTQEEKNSYTVFHLLIWNLKRTLEKFPLGKTSLASYAAALYLLRENVANKISDPNLLENKFVDMYGLRKHLFEDTNNQETILLAGEYELIRDMPGLGIKGDKILITTATKYVSIVLGYYIFKVKNSRTGSTIYVANSDILRIEP